MATQWPCGSFTGESDYPLPPKKKRKVALGVTHKFPGKLDRSTSQLLNSGLKSKLVCVPNKGKQKEIKKLVDLKDVGLNNKQCNVHFDGNRISKMLADNEARRLRFESEMKELRRQVEQLAKAIGLDLPQNWNQFPPPNAPQFQFEPQNAYHPPAPNLDLVAVPNSALTPISPATPNPIPTSSSALVPRSVKPIIPVSNSAFAPSVKPIPISNSAFAPPPVKPIPISNSVFFPQSVKSIPVLNSVFAPSAKPIPISNSAFATPPVKPIPLSNSAFAPPPVKPIPLSNSAFPPPPVKPIPVSNSAFAPPSVKPISISNSAFAPLSVNPIPIIIPTSNSAFVPPSVAASTSIRASDPKSTA